MSEARREVVSGDGAVMSDFLTRLGATATGADRLHRAARCPKCMRRCTAALPRRLSSTASVDPLPTPGFQQPARPLDHRCQCHEHPSCHGSNCAPCPKRARAGMPSSGRKRIQTQATFPDVFPKHSMLKLPVGLCPGHARRTTRHRDGLSLQAGNRDPDSLPLRQASRAQRESADRIAVRPLVGPPSNDGRGSAAAPRICVKRARAKQPTLELGQSGAEPPVHVTIGRIEVTAVTAAPAPRRAAMARKPTMSLDDYLARRQRREP